MVRGQTPSPPGVGAAEVGETLAEIANKTVDVMIAIFAELPSASSLGDFIDIVFRVERRAYVGVAIIVATLFLMVLA